MERYLICLLLIPLLLNNSCQKDDLSISHKMRGLLNAQTWEAEGEFTFNLPHAIGIDLGFAKYSSNGELRERLIVYKVPFEIGVYSIRMTTSQINEAITGAVYRTFSHDGDVIKDTYRLHTSAHNVIKITEADAEKNIVKGEVNATFLVDPLDRDNASIDTIHIENGLLEITLRD